MVQSDCGAVINPHCSCLCYHGWRLRRKASEMSVEPQSIKRHGYCLFTWPGKSDGVCFAIIPKYKSKKYMHNWFSKWGGECGLPLLKEELSALPNGEYVEWLNLPPKFTYPQRQVSEDLVDYGKKVGLDFRMSPGLDQRMFSDWP